MPSKRLLIARHGNTFDAGQTPLRVGKRTDLPLSTSGQQQAEKLGAYLRQQGILVDEVYTSSLKRTQQTAEIALRAAGQQPPMLARSLFDEIDYGPDEGKPEADVIARIGEQALADWDSQATVPDGWDVDPEVLVHGWMEFVRDILCGSAQTILVVTSNGTARFAPHITGDFEAFRQKYTLKLGTGALADFRWQNHHWQVDGWNIRP